MVRQMLNRERRRCVWSLVIGVAVGAAVFGYWYERARTVDARVRQLVANCEADSVRSKKDLPAGYNEGSWNGHNWVDACGIPLAADAQSKAEAAWEAKQTRPAATTSAAAVPSPNADKPAMIGGMIDDLGIFKHRWVPEDPGDRIADAAREADADRESGRYWALFTFATFCIPLGWYFILDRLREVRDALSGRDRSA
jgi:hypothetical protein